MFRKTGLTAAMLLAMLAFGSAVPMYASCEKDIRKAEHNLDKAVRKHGEHSRQAEERRHQLEEVRSRCHDRH